MSDPGRPAIKVGELSAREFERLLAGDGAGIRIGPFDGLFRVRVPGIAGPLQALYADHPLLDHERVFNFRLMLREAPRLPSGGTRPRPGVRPAPAPPRSRPAASGA